MNTAQEGGAKGMAVVDDRGSHCERAPCCSSGPQTLFFRTVRRPDRAPEAPPHRLEWARKDAGGGRRLSKALDKI